MCCSQHFPTHQNKSHIKLSQLLRLWMTNTEPANQEDSFLFVFSFRLLVTKCFNTDHSVFPSGFVVVITLHWLPKLLASHMDKWLLHVQHNTLHQRAVSILSQHICDETASVEIGQETETCLLILFGLTKHQSSDRVQARGSLCSVNITCINKAVSTEAPALSSKFSCDLFCTADTFWLILLNFLSILVLDSLKSGRKRETRDL